MELLQSGRYNLYKVKDKSQKKTKNKKKERALSGVQGGEKAKRYVAGTL